jgi:hypothetical protein
VQRAEETDCELADIATQTLTFNIDLYPSTHRPLRKGGTHVDH